jgi:hypothetical protein
MGMARPGSFVSARQSAGCQWFLCELEKVSAGETSGIRLSIRIQEMVDHLRLVNLKRAGQGDVRLMSVSTWNKENGRQLMQKRCGVQYGGVSYVLLQYCNSCTGTCTPSSTVTY